MKISIFKKIITTISLIIFLFGLFVSLNQIFAQTQDLTLTADKPTYKPGDVATITALVHFSSNKDFIFTSSPSGGYFIPVNGTCTPQIRGTVSYPTSSCAVEFQSIGEGTFTINASLGTLSSTTPITITISTLPPVNTPPGTNTPGTTSFTCPAGWNGSGFPPLCIGPAGAGVCPTGFGGTYPYCTVSTGTCPNGFSGACPLCIGPAGAGVCPTGFGGTYPYCTCPICPSSQIPVNGVCKTPVTLTPGTTITCPDKKVPSSDGTGCVTPTTNTTYQPLAPLSDNLKTIDTQRSDSNPCPFGNYLNIMIKIVIGFGAVLAMVMIVMGGIEYMTDELISGKEAGKERIRNAILGLLLALGAYLILNTINPQLLSACLDKLPQAEITILPFDANINSYVVKTDSASCKILTTGDCSPSNLQNYFGNKSENASKICSVESGGTAKNSNYDHCTNSIKDPTTFSFGLFQINLLANGDKIPSSVGNCANLFTTDAGKEIGYGKSGYVVAPNGKFDHYDCKLKSDRGTDYANCSSYLMTTAGNLDMAKKLFNNAGNTFKDWQPSDSKVCPSAFQ